MKSWFTNVHGWRVWIFRFVYYYDYIHHEDRKLLYTVGISTPGRYNVYE